MTASPDLVNTYRAIAGKPPFDAELRRRQLDLLVSHAEAVVAAVHQIDAYDLRAERSENVYEAAPDERISLVFTASTGGRPRDLATVDLVGAGTVDDLLVAREGRPSKMGTILASAPLGDTPAVIDLFGAVIGQCRRSTTVSPLDAAIEAGRPGPGQLVVISADTPLAADQLKVLALRHGITAVVTAVPGSERHYEVDADLIIRVDEDGNGAEILKNRHGRLGRFAGR